MPMLRLEHSKLADVFHRIESRSAIRASLKGSCRNLENVIASENLNRSCCSVGAVLLEP